MNRIELISALNLVLDQGNDLSTVVYAVLKETKEVKLLNIVNEEIEYIQEMFIESINSSIINAEGQTIVSVSEADDRSNTIFEYEAGFALPTLVTGKIGIGKKFNNTKVIVGIRPFPFNLYLQSSFPAGKKGYWIAALELNPLKYETILSFESKGILSFGYRWNLPSKN